MLSRNPLITLIFLQILTQSRYGPSHQPPLLRNAMHRQRLWGQSATQPPPRQTGKKPKSFGRANWREAMAQDCSQTSENDGCIFTTGFKRNIPKTVEIMSAQGLGFRHCGFLFGYLTKYDDSGTTATSAEPCLRPTALALTFAAKRFRIMAGAGPGGAARQDTHGRCRKSGGPIRLISS
jgi:hypothetical protein